MSNVDDPKPCPYCGATNWRPLPNPMHMVELTHESGCKLTTTKLHRKSFAARLWNEGRPR